MTGYADIKINSLTRGKVFFIRQVYPVHFRLPLIDVLPRYLLTAVLRFISSGHHLRIETGCWDKTPKQDRMCLHCDVIEDEIHVVTECPCYYDARKVLLQELQLSYNCGPQETVSAIGKLIRTVISSTEVENIISFCKICYTSCRGFKMCMTETCSCTNIISAGKDVYQ